MQLCHELEWPAVCVGVLQELFSSEYSQHRLFAFLRVVHRLKPDAAEALLSTMLTRNDCFRMRYQLRGDHELVGLIAELEEIVPPAKLLQTLFDTLVAQNQAAKPPNQELLESLRGTRSGRQLAQCVVSYWQEKLAENPPVSQVLLRALPPAFASCCDVCADFAAFYSSTAPAHSIRVNAETRKHLTKRITQAGLGVRTEVQSDSPYSLVVRFPIGYEAYLNTKVTQEQFEAYIAQISPLCS